MKALDREGKILQIDEGNPSEKRAETMGACFFEGHDSKSMVEVVEEKNSTDREDIRVLKGAKWGF